MYIFKKARNIHFIIFILFFSLGIFLRLYKYPFYPLTGHAEEYLFVWSGLSLIEEGVPISWSELPVYEEKHIYWQGIAPNPTGGGLGVRLIKPWLDEPPLYCLIVGGIAKLYSLPNFTIISPYVIRLPSLLFSCITLGLVFLLARKFFGYWMGILSLLIYGTSPVIVFGSRLAVPENLITTLMIASLLLIIDYLETLKKWKRNLAFLLIIIAGLAKPTGILWVPFLVSLLWQNKRWQEGIKVGIASLLIFFTTYFAYGFYFDKDLFLRTFLYQAQRPAGWSGLAFLITNPGFSIEVVLDGFLVLGVFALSFLLFKKKNKEEEIILFSFVFSLLIVVFSGGKHDQLAWYRYPIYPYLAIAVALLIRQIFTSPTFFSTAVLTPLILTNIDLLESPFRKLKFFIEPQFYRPAFALLLAPSICHFLLKNKIWLRLSRLVIVFVTATGVFFNIWVIKSFFNLLCNHTMCSLPQKIDLLRPIFLR